MTAGNAATPGPDDLRAHFRGVAEGVLADALITYAALLATANLQGDERRIAAGALADACHALGVRVSDEVEDRTGGLWPAGTGTTAALVAALVGHSVDEATVDLIQARAASLVFEEDAGGEGEGEGSGTSS